MNKQLIMTSNCDQSTEMHPIFANVAQAMRATTAATGPCPNTETPFRIPSGASVCS